MAEVDFVGIAPHRLRGKAKGLVIFVAYCIVEYAVASNSDASLKSLTFQRRRRRDTDQKLDVKDYNTLHTGSKSYVELYTNSYSGIQDIRVRSHEYPGLPGGLNWNSSALNGSAWVYNPPNFCPTTAYNPGAEYKSSSGYFSGKEDVGPYLIVHPIPTDPGATVKVTVKPPHRQGSLPLLQQHSASPAVRWVHDRC